MRVFATWELRSRRPQGHTGRVLGRRPWRVGGRTFAFFVAALLLLFLLILPSFTPTLGGTGTTLDRQKLAEELAVQKAALSQASAELNALQADFDKLAVEHNAIEVRLAELEGEIREAEKDIAQAEQDLSAVQARLEERLVSLYKQKSSSVSVYVEVLLNEDDLASVLKRVDTLNDIAQEDQELFDEVTGYLEASWAAKELLQQKQAEQATDLERLVQVEEETYQKLASSSSQYQALKSQVSKLKAEIAKVDAETAAAEKRRLQAKIARQAGLAWDNGSDGTIQPPPFTFPVQGVHSFADTWGAPRSGGRVHRGCDVMAAEGTPLVACVTGIITSLCPSDIGLGGIYINLRGNNGYVYFYCHLSRIAPGIGRGTSVKAGQVVGYVGTTGNASRTCPHLHFGMRPGGGGNVNPYATLKYYDQ
jgi:murein DD-endopeptidase MepM/ murein hydrolase activator NlpD